jgi:hypothetical protein
MDEYFDSQRDRIFRNVEGLELAPLFAHWVRLTGTRLLFHAWLLVTVVMYVFDVKSDDQKMDLENFGKCLEAIRASSKVQQARPLSQARQLPLGWFCRAIRMRASSV